MRSWHGFSSEEEKKEADEIGAANFAVLERLRVSRREEHLKVEYVTFNSCCS